MYFQSRLAMLAASVAFVASAFAFVSGAEAQEKKVTIVGWGGASQDAYRKAYWEPYAKETGVKILEDYWDGEFSKLLAMVQAKNVTWDILIADYAHAVEGCDLDILVPIPSSIVGDTNDYFPGSLHQCGASMDVFSWIWGYDSQKIPAAWGASRPKDTADVWSTAKFSGKRGLKKEAKTTLEIALLGDGVPASQLYGVFTAPGGVERAMAKLESMKKDIILYAKLAQGPQLLIDGEVSLLSTVAGRLSAANKEGKKFVTIWDQQIYSVNTVIVPKGPRSAEALKLLAYHLKPESQARSTTFIDYGPTRKSAFKHVDPKTAANLPTAPEHMKNAVSRNEDWWTDHLQEVNEKWNVLMLRW